MVRLRRFLARESARHAVASTAAAIVAAVIALGIRFFAGDIDPSTLSPVSVTLLFGLYGPAFLALTSFSFRHALGDDLRDLLRATPEHRGLLRWLFISGPTSWAFTVLAIGVASAVLLSTGDSRSALWIVPVCVLGVAGTWVLMCGVMAVEYMRRWALEDPIDFPGQEERTFSDFVYLSVQLSTTFSSSDIQLTKTSVRKIASIHSVLAFAYSTAVIAVFASLLISITTQA